MSERTLAFKIVTRVVLPLAILGGAAVVARALFLVGPTAERKKPAPRVAAVEVVEVQPRDATASVRANGAVEAALRVDVVPQITGKVSWVSPSLVPGGRFDKGDTLLRIEAGDYALQVRQQRSAVDRARLDLKIEKGRGRIAEKEWALIGEGADEQEKELGLRKPHLDSAKSAVRSAKASLSRAKMDLGRTTLRAPFNATVVAEQVDVGQVVGPSSLLATLVGVDRLWVRVSVPMEQLADIHVPGVNAEEGSPAVVVNELGQERYEWSGRVERLVSQLETETRTAQVIVAVDNPFDAPDGGLPLLPGSYVTVEIEGKVKKDVFVVPRTALHEGQRIWVVGKDSMLRRRPVVVTWSSPEEVFVTGLRPGDRVVTSPMSLPIDGMKVKIHTPEEKKGSKGAKL